jgi:UrcA family protein
MKSRSLRYALTLLFLAAPLATTVAQDIIVTAPRNRVVGRSPTTGAPIELLTTSAIVNVRDLNLRTVAGKNEARRRVEAAAHKACEWLEQLYPLDPPAPNSPPCVADAVRRAMAGAHAMSPGRRGHGRDW